MLRLYLDFLTKQALANASELEEYTPEMAAADDELIADVEAVLKRPDENASVFD